MRFSLQAITCPQQRARIDFEISRYRAKKIRVTAFAMVARGKANVLTMIKFRNLYQPVVIRQVQLNDDVTQGDV